MNKQYSARRALGAVALVLSSCSASEKSIPQSNGTEHSSGTALVEEYITRDRAGERLRASDWFSRHSTWREEPAWDTFVLVSGHSILHSSAGEASASATVAFKVVGRVTASSDHYSFVEAAGVDTVTYRSAKDSLGWRLLSPTTEPHLNVGVALARMNLDSLSRFRLIRFLPSAP